MAAAYLFAPYVNVPLSCAKRQYESRRKALRAMRMHRTPSGLTQVGAGVMNAYQCQYCTLWHIGHIRRTKATQIEAA